MIFALLIVVALILFFNGFVVLGKYSGKQVAWLNLGAGLSIWIMGLFIGMTDNLGAVGPTQSFVATASCMVFALTYLLLAGEIVAGTDFKALGYYCFIAGLIMFLLGLGFFHVLGFTLIASSQFGVLWLMWAALFWLFLGLLGTRQGRLGSIYGVLYGFHGPVYRALSGHRLFQFGAYRLVSRVTSTRRAVV